MGGLDYAAGAAFANNGGAFPQVNTWYIGLINITAFVQLASNDTMSSHAGWAEFTGYSGNRPQWVNQEGAQTVSSNGQFSFPITANATVHGMFVTSSNSVGGSSGTLWSTALLSVDANVTIAQILTGTYSVVYAGG